MTRVAVAFHLIYCMNDFLTDFIRRLKSSNRLDRNGNLMFRPPLGLLQQNFSRPLGSSLVEIYLNVPLTLLCFFLTIRN